VAGGVALDLLCERMRDCEAFAQDMTRLLICRELMKMKQMLGFDFGDWARVRNMLRMLIWTEEDQGIGLELWEDICQIVQP
jgi:hypothetical protein